MQNGVRRYLEARIQSSVGKLVKHVSCACDAVVPATHAIRSFGSGPIPGADEQAQPQQGFVKGNYTPKCFPQERIRNFSIIAHVDHGKSTLADRLMEVTGALRASQVNQQYLDKLEVERQRGITVKAQTVSLVHRHTDGIDYLLNLIDTPGHVDFSYEGVQAQTMANFYLAEEGGLAILPALSKVDLRHARVAEVAEEVEVAVGTSTAEILQVSGKSGQGIADLLAAIVERIPCPRGRPEAPLRMLLFDAYHDEFRGVICLVEVIDGSVAAGDKIVAASTQEVYEVAEVGVLAPEHHATGALLTGQVGYMITGMKNTASARVGDTFHRPREAVELLPGFKPSKSMVYAGIYPAASDDFEPLSKALQQVVLTDASVSWRRENTLALGAGFRCGFQGMLHMEVFYQRLEQEHDVEVITTAPTVPFRLKTAGSEAEVLERPTQYPLDQQRLQVEEPVVKASIVLPSEYVGRVMELCQDRRGELTSHAVMGSSGERTLLSYDLPLAELGSNFHDALKTLTSGYASFDYEDQGEYRVADLVRLDILVNGEAVDALTRIVHRSKAAAVGKKLCQKLKDMMDRQQFEVPIQAAANGKIIARETVKAVRKNVLAKCYGGDISRKRKLLEQQKEGKKRMRSIGSVRVPSNVYATLMAVGS